MNNELINNLYNKLDAQEDMIKSLQLVIVKQNEIIQELKDIEKYWLQGGTYCIPCEVINNILCMIDEVEDES